MTEPGLLATYAVQTDAGTLLFEVLRRGPREVVMRLRRNGGAAGIPLTTMQAAAMRVALSRCLEVATQIEGRRAA